MKASRNCESSIPSIWEAKTFLPENTVIRPVFFACSYLAVSRSPPDDAGRESGCLGQGLPRKDLVGQKYVRTLLAVIGVVFGGLGS